MISFTDAQWNALIAAYFYPFARVMAWLTTDPVLGNRSVPMRLRIGLAIALAVILAPQIGPLPAVDVASAMGVAILAQQVLIGICLGFAVRVVFAAVEAAGQLAGLQMGLGFATFFDPQTSAQVPVVGQYLGLVATLVFLSLNGHAMLITALAESFRLLPVGMSGFSAAGLGAYAAYGAQVFALGLALSLPVIAALLIANLGIGVISRAAPQMNIFAVGFPFTLLVGMAALYLTLPYFVPLLERVFTGGIESAVALLRGLAPVPAR